ncbi:MAG: rhomboid family intramembrane serine protease [Treponema sp.]|jgi:membrane associated rhomboid family serine protease|nr:rhomboid family intramembrane serine protease [Treponema sp.]
MKIKYNSPTVLTFAFASASVLVLSQTIMRTLTMEWFMVPGKGGFFPASFRNWITLFTHVLGHANWPHLVSNFSFILLIGPILEEIYGSFPVFIMISITALVTGVLNVLFFSSGLLGASGVVFMMILLASFTNFSKGEIPLTFILVLVLYLGRELFISFGNNTDSNISEFAHIVGGFIGSLFGFFRLPRGTHR